MMTKKKEQERVKRKIKRQKEKTPVDIQSIHPPRAWTGWSATRVNGVPPLRPLYVRGYAASHAMDIADIVSIPGTP